MTAGPAAGTGGTSRKRAAVSGRAAKLKRARAAGAAGNPAPPWIDDAELLEAYDQGASSLGSTWAGDVDTDSTDSDAGGDNGGSGSDPAADASNPAPGPTTRGGSRKGGSGGGSRRSIGPVRPTGTAGDAAGAFLGVIAAAFVTNAIRGTWTDWLKAKFLNQVSDKTASGFNAPPTTTTGPNGSASVGPSSPGGPSGPSITNNPDGSQSLSPGGID